MLRRLGVFLATGLCIGYAPVAPGTFGSLLGLAVFRLVRQVGSSGLEAATITVLAAVGVWSATQAEIHFGRSDPGPIVIDEIVGMLVTLAFVPVNIIGVLVAFGLFRLLDVVKPWPARRFERLPGGLGVVADDVAAGMYGNLIMWVLLGALPSLRS